jgi:GNAT superfamily N-acetyltransferase
MISIITRFRLISIFFAAFYARPGIAAWYDYAMRTISIMGIDALDAIMSLVTRAIARMDGQGIPQWDEVYPNRNDFAADIGARCLYGLAVDGALAGIVTLNEEQDEEYAEVAWRNDDPKPLVVHRLCVDPDHQGKGCAKALLDFAEDYARAHGYRTIRLDAFTLNPVSLSLYRTRGYSERGVVRFRKGLFVCFEKSIVTGSSGRTA